MHYYYYYMLLYYYTILRPHSSFLIISCIGKSFPGGSDGKESACNARGLGSIDELGRSPGEGNGNPLLYSCLENSMGRGAWWATIHGVTKSWTKLSDQHFHTFSGKNPVQNHELHLVVMSLSPGTVPHTCLDFHDLDTFEGYRSVILQSVPQSVWPGVSS